MRKKIKLFVDAHVFDIHRQGTTTYVAGIYNQLLQYPDLEIHFGVQQTDKLKKEIPAAEHIIKYEKSGFVSRYFTEVPKILEHNSFDFAHFQYIVPLVKKQTKYITTVHDVLFMDYPQYFSPLFRLSRRLLFKYSLMKSEIKLTVSDYSKKCISHHFGVPVSDLHVTPNGGPVFSGIDQESSKQYVHDVYGLQKYILYVSRIESRKNHCLLVDAFEEIDLGSLGYRLVFVGRADDDNSKVSRWLQNKIAQNEFITHISDIGMLDLEHLYNAASLFVYPSLAEGFGIPPLEAAACNIPVLCSNRTAMGDFSFFANGLFNPEKFGELVSKMKGLLVDKNLKLPEDLSRTIFLQYNWKASAEVLYGLLSQYHS